MNHFISLLCDSSIFSLWQVLDHTINDEQKVGICSVDVKGDIQNVRTGIQEAEDYVGKCVDVLVNCAGYYRLYEKPFTFTFI